MDGAPGAGPDHLGPPDPPRPRVHGRLRRPLRGERRAPLAAAARRRRPRPQLARRQPRRHARPPPARREAALRLLRRPPRRRLRRAPRAGGARPLRPHEPPRGGEPPRGLLPARDRDLPRDLRDRPLQDLVGAVRRHGAADPPRRGQRLRPLLGPASPWAEARGSSSTSSACSGPRASWPSRRSPGSGGPGRSRATRAGRRPSGPTDVPARRRAGRRSSRGRRFRWCSRRARGTPERTATRTPHPQRGIEQPGLPDPGGSSRPPDPLDPATASGCRRAP